MEESFYKKPDIEDELISEKNQINFGAIFEILFRRKKIFLLVSIIFFLITSTNLIYRRIKKPIYRGSFTLMVSDPFLNSRTKSNSIESLALNQETLDIPTLVQYLKSPGVVSKIAKNNDISPLELIKMLTISVPRNDGRLNTFLSKTLSVRLDGENKFKMQKILKELSSQYIINASELRNEKLSEGINFLNSEKPKLLLRVKEAQNNLEKFRLKNKIINPIIEGEKLTDFIEKNQNEILLLKSENIRLGFIKENLVNGILYTEGISPNTSGLGVIGSDQLLLEEILDVKSRLANAQSKYKKSSIVIQNLNEKLKQLEPVLLKNQKSAVEAAIIVNNSLIKSYENQLTELQKKFIEIPSKVTEYSTIIQNLKGLEKNLQSLNETKDKLELELSQGILPWKIIQDPFVNPYPIKPEIKRNLIYIILSTFAFASLITLLIEKYDDVFHNSKEVEKFIKLPILGFVPFLKINENDNESDIQKTIKISDLLEFNKKGILKNMKFIFEETFRNIYTSIKFSKSDKEIKIITITSTIPEEGKSLCSLSLAINISQISKKVLIIDTDLRKPSLHKRLDVDNVLGISNYLVNNDADWSNYINKHDSIENLSYLTAGKIPPNSISLLESKKMKSLIQDLRNSDEFDFIILDCPPLLGLSDALILSNYADGAILTISLNKVNKKLAQECLKKLNLIEDNILGTIINSVSKDLNTNFLGNKYYSYSNQYNYYSYKYMPKETQNRYLNENKISNNKENNTEDSSENLSKINKLLKKASLAFTNFMQWLNE